MSNNGRFGEKHAEAIVAVMFVAVSIANKTITAFADETTVLEKTVSAPGKKMNVSDLTI